MMMGGFLLVLLLGAGVVLLLVVGGAGWLASQRGRSGPTSASDGAPRTPREILDARLASGEIDVETYRALLSELDNGGVLMGWGTGCGWGALGRGLGLFHMGGGGILGILGSLLALGFFVGLVTLFAVSVVWAVRRSRTPSHGATTPAGEALGRERPLELAQRRLALGEISLEEYRRIREQLEA